MTDKTQTTDDRFAGFSSDELLRRARLLRDISDSGLARDRRKLDRLALDHENAARTVRSKAHG